MLQDEDRPPLEVYDDGEAYDLQPNPTQDVPFYVARARASGGPVLELACGTGRVTLPLARAGLQVTGLDASAPMLARARAKAAAEGLAVRWVEGDCTRFSLEARFRLILLPFNALAHVYTRAQFEGFCRSVLEHLEPEGRLVFSVFNPDFKYFLTDPEHRYPSFEYDDPATGAKVRVEETSRYDKAEQVNYIVWHYLGEEGGERARRLPMRIYFPQELDALLHYNGFAVDEKLGSFEGEPFDTYAPIQVFVCSRKREGSPVVGDRA